jgi:predicted ester cyclase
VTDLPEFLRQAWSDIDNGGNIAALDKYFAPHYVRHGRKDWSREQFRELLAELYAGFPDLRQVTFDAIHEGDRVAYRWESEGTHLGPYLGALPTGRKIQAKGITITRFENGLIVEDWASWNELSVLHDIGIMPIDR